MIISNSRKFIFVHISKTAGTSITDALAPQLAWNDLVLGSTPVGAAMDRPFLERFGLYKHSSAREIRNVVGTQIWGEYRSFAVLRDPIDRTASLYRFLKRIEASRSELRQMLRGLLGRGRRKWPALHALRETAGFSDFIRHPRLPEDPGFAPQHAFVADMDGTVIVDTLLRFDTLEADFRGLCRELGLGVDRLGHQNRSDGGGDPVAVSDADAAFLRARFARDYALLDALVPDRQKAGDLQLHSG